MDTLKKWSASFSSFWASLKVWQRASIALVTLLLLGGLGFLMFRGSKVNYDAYKETAEK